MIKRVICTMPHILTLALHCLFQFFGLLLVNRESGLITIDVVFSCAFHFIYFLRVHYLLHSLKMDFHKLKIIIPKIFFTMAFCTY